MEADAVNGIDRDEPGTVSEESIRKEPSADMLRPPIHHFVRKVKV